jgi:hypothetical protein
MSGGRWRHRNHCGRCGRRDSEHGTRPEDGPSYCGWTLVMVRRHRANPINHNPTFGAVRTT